MMSHGAGDALTTMRTALVVWDENRAVVRSLVFIRPDPATPGPVPLIHPTPAVGWSRPYR
jgi:hypothetical protein